MLHVLGSMYGSHDFASGRTVTGVEVLDGIQIFTPLHPIYFIVTWADFNSSSYISCLYCSCIS